VSSVEIPMFFKFRKKNCWRNFAKKAKLENKISKNLEVILEVFTCQK